MTDKNLTEIVCVIDKSGSMFNLQEDTIGGYNSYITEQKKTAGKVKATLIQFNSNYQTVYDGIDINDVKDLTKETYCPNGGTALFDSVGFAINSIGKRLENTKEEDRPGQVIFVVITDGQENSSKEFRGDIIRNMVKHQSEKYNWNFIYLGGGDLETHKAQGINIGFAPLNVYNYSANAVGTRAVYQAVSNSTTRARSDVMKGVIRPIGEAFLSDEEVNSLNNQKP